MDPEQQATDPASQAEDQSSQAPAADQDPPGVTMEPGEEAPTEPAAAGAQEDPGAGDSTDTPFDQEAVNKRINKLTFEKHEERRLREEAEAKAQEKEAELAKLKAKEAEIEIPPMPDTFDPEYQEKLKKRDDAIAELAKVNAKKELAEQSAAQRAQEAIEAHQAEVQKHVNTMYSEAEKLGVKQDELQKADGILVQYIKNPELAVFIISQPDAALLVKHLSSSPQELDKLSKMTTAAAAAYIATTVAPKAQELKPGLTNTPDPLKLPKGKGAKEEPNPYMKGVVME